MAIEKKNDSHINIVILINFNNVKKIILNECVLK